MGLKKFHDQLRKVNEEVILSRLLVIIKDHEQDITNANTDQLYAGKDSVGKSLPNYSARSVAVFGKRSGPFRLFDSGDFYRGFFVNASKLPITIFSNDSKTEKIAYLLQSKGHNPDDIYGLDATNSTDIKNNYLAPDLRESIRKLLFL